MNETTRCRLHERGEIIGRSSWPFHGERVDDHSWTGSRSPGRLLAV
ncbi:MAG: hypothetical protein IPH43_04700 [Xanthomonadales bacterium]|nr:hypothetical protein [Xanthomonadales bacterium]